MTGPEQRRTTVLIVDDEEKLRDFLRRELERKGCAAAAASDGDEALAALARAPAEVVLLDIRLPGKSGIEVLRQIRDSYPWTRVIMLTGNATVDTALEAMKLGAYDYITKPCDLTELRLLIDKAAQQARLLRANEVLSRDRCRRALERPFIGEDRALRETLRLAEKAAGSEVPVLLQGETGTGKEVLARVIHARSRRASEPFVAVNCSAFPDSLLLSELFGHEKGAFTDALETRPGVVELARGATLFLDEIGETSPAAQAALLRFLDAGEFRRVGGETTLRSDARIVSATNRDLTAAVRAKTFREDLLFRLNTFTIRLPPLRERPGDIPLLAEHFLRGAAAALGKSGLRLSAEALDALTAYGWPGNVRELEHAVTRAAIVCEDTAILRAHVLPAFEPRSEPAAAGTSLAEIERRHILLTLSQTQGNKAQAARLLDIDAKTLYNKLRQYDEDAGRS